MSKPTRSRRSLSKGRNSDPATSASRIQRLAIGLLALVFLAAGVTLAVFPIFSIASRQFVSGTLLKVGVVLGLAWVAAPQLERIGWEKLRGTALAAVLLVLVLWSVRPRLGAIAAGALAVVGGFFAISGWLRNTLK